MLPPLFAQKGLRFNCRVHARKGLRRRANLKARGPANLAAR